MSLASQRRSGSGTEPGPDPDTWLADSLRHVLAACEAIPTAVSASILVLDASARVTIAIDTGEAFRPIDAAQCNQGAGPCLDAWRQKEIVRVQQVRDRADQYPAFSRAALGSGILSTLSLPLVVADVGVGVLSLYAESGCGFDSTDEAVAVDLAAVASTMLSLRQAYSQPSAEAEGLGEAMRSRAVIEQAKGVLMARTADLGPDEAFAVLVSASQRENAKVRDIAQQVVERRALPGTEASSAPAAGPPPGR